MGDGGGITPNPALLRPPSHVLINVGLALIPVLLAFLIVRLMRDAARDHRRPSLGLLLPLLILWLAFLPNTVYLLTEWRHYLWTIDTTPVFLQAFSDRSAVVTLLMVTAFYMLYTNAGVLTFFLALWPLDRLTRRRLGRIRYALLGLIFLLCALGVYLGLVWRFNSIDVMHPHHLLLIFAVIGSTLKSPVLAVMITLFALLLWFLYFLFEIWMEGALARAARYDARG